MVSKVQNTICLEAREIKSFAKQSTRVSLKNWLNLRNKAENQYSKDYLYIKPDGEPLGNEDQLRMFINKKAGSKIREIIPFYYNYLSRYWCSIARLIRTKIESKKFDEYEVSEWMGHTKIETTMTYIKDAKFYYKKAPYDWLKRVLKNYENGWGKHAKIDKQGKNLGYEWNFSERGARRLPDSNRRPLG